MFAIGVKLFRFWFKIDITVHSLTLDGLDAMNVKLTLGSN